MKKKSFHTFEEKKEKEINAAIDLFSSNSKFYNFIQKLNEKPWKIFYKGLLPKKIKKIIDKQADFYQQEYVEQCWDKIIGEYFKLKENEGKTPIDHIISKKKIENRKIIWQYWGTGWENKELPDIVKLCMKSVEKYKGDYTIIRLDDNNLKKYIIIAQIIKFFNLINQPVQPSIAAFSTLFTKSKVRTDWVKKEHLHNFKDC